MSEATERAVETGGRRLSDSVRDVKNAIADRDDVVVELREAQKMRIELLAAELAPVFSEVPQDVDIFDFAVSSGLQPRLWIDAVSHVGMGRDRRTYRFVKDSRLGRVVLAESSDMKTVADQVGRYVAERLIERERAMEGKPEPVLVSTAAAAVDANPSPASQFWAFVGLALTGALVGGAVTALLLSERLAALITP